MARRGDAWAQSYFDPWADIDTESEWKAGVSSFMSPLNWDSAMRLEALETESIVAEVIFPNTVPPFFPNGQTLGHHSPRPGQLVLEAPDGKAPLVSVTSSGDCSTSTGFTMWPIEA